ncbi:MAG: asparagine synthase (glutamine-hydrolyzing) [Alphaproteobacteria bacterium 16-39-46]|nr:MAG: asparagine synthase (glutamine-hydrolyzing) [Alphaproteobacteria bacterium 16-39-46]OZA41865.1 MAG: asparagine synthase (glutamine-hydrolyzing) [Alphaproteobacteria bacterium 17-39-52]HQS84670.1 asparagine synthase (glutamine-hydrolyzing) [Alphaproteobacteria bacterium]HQS94494.1 asparagine synthase (glutamine-hydrolyzing) [Alphaproteobacteria bacterium]
MCGITGFWDFRHAKGKEENVKIVCAMSDELASRGPDASGFWQDDSDGLFLGHRRLSIIDLSEHGAQPMVSSSQKYVITYNGEIFNASELRSELSRNGVSFRGYSDTEVILEACEQWGVEKACQKFNGMFAFALWSRNEKKLYLVRDRIGIKPLYWGIQKNILFFSSELKSLKKHPLWTPTLSSEGLGLYLKFNYIRAPHTIYKNMFKVNPGCYIEIDAEGHSKEIPFWKLSDHFIQKKEHASMTPEMHQEFLESLLKDSVKRRMVSDVPIGAFLSGGIDSSLVTALMQESSSTPVKTFSIGFEETSYDEAPYAKAIARHLNTDHHELYLNAQDALNIIPSLSHMYDEPFADASQIPTFLVSQLSRGEVTVTLSGDGGDELFLGYDRYQIGKKLYNYQKFIPTPLKKFLGKSLKSLSVSQWDHILNMMPNRYQSSNLSEKAYKLSDVLEAQTPLDFFQSLVSIWDDPTRILTSPLENPPSLYPPETLSFLEDPLRLQSYGDLKTYLPECILTKVDRASMSIGLEARVPLLDYRIVEYAAGLPSSLKLSHGETKYPLRKILSKYVPSTLIDRPKKGFSIPLGTWLRGPLRDWAESLLSQNALSEDTLFKPEIIRSTWEDHLSGKANFEYKLWGILMFQQWRKSSASTFLQR